MKIIAWHLPQFHEIPENNEWWGKGFTEWTNVKKAMPLFSKHNQPRVPLNNNYYNLLNKKTMEWQYELSSKYNIYGFCYYHYWFNGKLLLEKPVENLFKWKDIPQRFCFSWANEPWTRTWSGQNRQMLISQEYGNESEWEKHIEYLIPFFEDGRYIRIDNKPVFLIYRTQSIPRCQEMIEYFDTTLKSKGFNGIYLIETMNVYQAVPHCDNSDAIVYMEPMSALKEISDKKGFFEKAFRKVLKKTIYHNKPSFTDYNKILKIIEERKSVGNKTEYLSAFVDWDNTPRRGKLGQVLKGAELDAFKKQLVMLSKKTKEDILFVNAWNEWAEGTYLEPDEKNGYGLLESIKEVFKEN